MAARAMLAANLPWMVSLTIATSSNLLFRLRMIRPQGSSAGLAARGERRWRSRSCAFCLAIVIVSVLGGLLPLATVLNHTRLQVYLSFSAGTMLGAAFFHMMPEAVRVGSAGTVHWTAFGLLALFFLERFFSFHHHEDRRTGRRTMTTTIARHAYRSMPGSTIIRADAETASNAVERPALGFGGVWAGRSFPGGGYRAGQCGRRRFPDRQWHLGAGLGVFVATLVHKPADALTITSLMLRAGERAVTRISSISASP